MKTNESQTNIEITEAEDIVTALSALKAKIVPPLSFLENIIAEANTHENRLPIPSKVWMLPRFFVPIGFALFIILAGTGYRFAVVETPTAYKTAYAEATTLLNQTLATQESALTRGEPDFLSQDETDLMRLNEEL